MYVCKEGGGFNEKEARTIKKKPDMMWPSPWSMTFYKGHDILSSHMQTVPNKNFFIKDLSHAKDRQTDWLYTARRRLWFIISAWENESILSPLNRVDKKKCKILVHVFQKCKRVLKYSLHSPIPVTESYQVFSPLK